MTDIVDRLLARQMMQDVRGTGDRFVKQIAVPDALCQQAADEIERLRAEVEKLKLDAGLLRLCVTCGKVRDASITKDEPGCEPSEYGHLCLFDATPMEAFLHWRQVAHDRAAELFALRAEVERHKDLLQAVEWMLDDGHLNQEHLARIRAAWEAAMAQEPRG